METDCSSINRQSGAQRRKPWGMGGHVPPRIWSGGRQCIMSPQILTFSLYFSLIQSVSRISVARAKQK